MEKEFFGGVGLLEKHVGASLLQKGECQVAETLRRHVGKVVVVCKVVQDLPLCFVPTVGLAQIEIILGVVINLSGTRVKLVQPQTGVVGADLISKHGFAGGNRGRNEQVR